MGRLDGKVAVVIGGATGFGLATAQRFVDEGATMVIAGRRGALADEVGAALGGSGVECDITDEASVAALVDATIERHDALDVMVNYAGYEQNTPIADLDSETLRRMVDVQFIGAVQVIRHAANTMGVRGGGSIVSVSSLTAHTPRAGRPPTPGRRPAWSTSRASPPSSTATSAYGSTAWRRT